MSRLIETARSRGAVLLSAAAVVVALASASSASAASAATPRCTITGTAGADILRGTPKRDVICGRGGDDTIRAGRGNDLILAGGGDDRVFGGPGADQIDGGRGDDAIYGGTGADGLYGNAGDDKVVGGAGDDQTLQPPLRANSNWQVNANVTYDLPTGTTVTWDYDGPSGNCITSWRGRFTDTVDGTTQLHPMFSVVVGDPWESCAWERSYGAWNVTALTPSGDTGTRSVRFVTGAPNIASHFAESQCQSTSPLACAGGSDTQAAKFGHVPTPPVRIGPLAPGPEPARRDPQLICNADLIIPVGKAISTGKGHICTIEGYPRPDIRITGLPEGLTMARWPTVKDTWLVLAGTPKARFNAFVGVTASLPNGWHDIKWINLDIG